MYFDFRTFFRLGYLSFFKWKDSPVRLTVKRVLFLIGFFSIFPIVQSFNAICLLIDRMLFLGYKKIEIKKPVFIVGNPRSGTTLLHRIMARDERQFFCFRTWEIIFPAIIQKKILSYIGRIDRLLGHIGSESIRRFEKKILGDFYHMHPTGLFYPEEDEMLMIHIFSSIYLVFLFPFPQEIKWLERFDELARPEDQKRIMTFYRSCVRRQAYYKGGKRTLLSKNPLFSPKIKSLYDYFPDCKIIYLVRNPLEVIPSMQNELYATCIYSNSQMRADNYFQEVVYETAKYFYNYPLAQLSQTPKNSYIIVNYEDLIRSPSSVIQMVYKQFGFELYPEYLVILNEEEEKAKGYKSRHVYSIDQFNFTQEQIVSDFKNIFDRFHFDTGESTGQ